jgi:hypothetical protein
VVLCGGDGGTELADAWQWDGADWHAAAPLPVPRQLTAAAWSPHDAAVLALGGAQNVFNGWVPAPVPLTDGPQAFDGAVWRGLQPGVLEGASYDPGRGEFVGLANWTNALWRWNGELWRQETVVPPWASTADIAFDSVRQRLVFVTGTGYTTGGHAETWEYANGIWTLPPATTPRPYVELVFDAARGQTLCPSPFGTLAWQGAGWATAPVTVPPHNLGLLFDPGRGSVLAVGTSSLGATEIWQWNGSAWSLLHASNTGPTGSGRTVVDQVRNRVVTHVSSTGVSWEWDGTAWAPIASMAPYLRRGSLVHDARRQQTVLVTDRTWVLSRAPAAAVAYGSACGAAAPRLIAFGAPRVGRHDFAVDVHAAANAATPVFVAFSVLPGSRPLPGGCTLLLANVDALGFVQTDASGFASVRLPLPDDVAARGATVFLQAGVLGGGVLSTSAGLRLLLGD